MAVPPAAAANQAKAFAAHGVKQGLKPWTFELRTLGDDDIELQVTHCGQCHSDLHTIDGEWGDRPWPVVPGHEIVGIITQVGPKVTRLKVGQRVGVGPQAFSCASCELCKTQHENYCDRIVETYGTRMPDGYVTQGGYARYHRVHEHFAVPVPESLPSDGAAPLLCAGVTVYTPLKYAKVAPGMRVGVVGIGGLGHLGLQMAAAMGAEVTAISTSAHKEAEARKFGASRFLLVTDAQQITAHRHYFHVILNTASAPIDLPQMLSMIQSRGTFVTVGAPPQPLSFKPSLVLGRNLVITGTMIGSPSEIEEMLHFCAQHKILPTIETLPWSRCNEGMDKLRNNTVRYRCVLVMDDDNTAAAADGTTTVAEGSPTAKRARRGDK